MWLHLGASRCGLRELVYDIGRIRAGVDVEVVRLEEGLESTEEAGGVMVVGSRAGLELEGDLGGGVDVDSVERVVRFVSFVGDSAGGGKSLGWLRVATMFVAALLRGLNTGVRRAMRGSVKTKVERGLYEEVTSDVCASDPFTSAHFSSPRRIEPCPVLEKSTSLREQQCCCSLPTSTHDQLKFEIQV